WGCFVDRCRTYGVHWHLGLTDRPAAGPRRELADTAMSCVMKSRLRLVAVALTAVLVIATGLSACSAKSQDARKANPPASTTAGVGFNGTLIDQPLHPAHR